MHVIRDWATRQQQQGQSSSFSRSNSNRLRRISVQDAVFLTAHVMLPLLQQMHTVGIVHRDVKPSNVVKRAVTATSQDFCLVDFGLSKSIVVPSDSILADLDHLWQSKDWMKTTPTTATNGGVKDQSSTSTTSGACYRKERESADFRGTSMYASVQVHQLRDYSPRDDVWSLLYVFCDLVSGGLPWMSHAAARDRMACQKLKERIHGMAPQADGNIRPDTKRLLMGDDYHVELYKKYKGDIDLTEENQHSDAGTENKALPEPLSLSSDSSKVQLLEKAFEHLKRLKFTDMPDYDLVRQCLEGFLDGSEESNTLNTDVPPIDWKVFSTSFRSRLGGGDDSQADTPLLNSEVPSWDFQDPDDKDPLELEDSNLFGDVAFLLRNTPEDDYGDPLYGEAADLARLPIEMRYRIAQMDYNASHESTIAPHLALRDWFKVALPLLYGTWDSLNFEKGGHRFIDDGYRRECYLRVVEKCIDCASTFKDFRNRKCIYQSMISTEGEPKPKRRNIVSTMSVPGIDSLGSDLIALSKVSFELRMVQKAEEVLPRAPPPRLTFGS
jgi:serine/threonine protein kinase